MLKKFNQYSEETVKEWNEDRIVKGKFFKDNLVKEKISKIGEGTLRDFVRMLWSFNMMVTHNMKDAIKYGNRLMMMHEGQIILDIRGEEKQRLTVENLLDRFGNVSGEEFTNDQALLS